ncbi:DUF1987 domain-containing protein [Roseivirga sp.]|uniref:DUF1987 domain-containing protein n=1 Tax=Roseivirga sp. TaxID=1964215 RepID=UPI003B8AA82F
MSDFELSSTSGSPGVLLKAQTGECAFTGYSIPQNNKEFYRPILNWLKEYAEQPAEQTCLTMQMEYMDNASRKVFANILNDLKSLHQKHLTKVTVAWYFKPGNEDMAELGKRLQAETSLNFSYSTLN